MEIISVNDEIKGNKLVELAEQLKEVGVDFKEKRDYHWRHTFEGRDVIENLEKYIKEYKPIIDEFLRGQKQLFGIEFLDEEYHEKNVKKLINI